MRPLALVVLVLVVGRLASTVFGLRPSEADPALLVRALEEVVPAAGQSVALVLVPQSQLKYAESASERIKNVDSVRVIAGSFPSTEIAPLSIEVVQWTKRTLRVQVRAVDERSSRRTQILFQANRESEIVDFEYLENGPF